METREITANFNAKIEGRYWKNYIKEDELLKSAILVAVGQTIVESKHKKLIGLPGQISASIDDVKLSAVSGNEISQNRVRHYSIEATLDTIPPLLPQTLQANCTVGINPENLQPVTGLVNAVF
jgi:hypothetical protein